MTIQETTIKIWWYDDERPGGVDAEEWAYTLRMGGINVDEVTEVQTQTQETQQEFMVCEIGTLMHSQASVLDAYGLNGWSLVTVRETKDGRVIAYLQREKKEQ